MLYDTTLRDGEQTPEVCFTPEQKLEIAIALEEAGIDEIEAGFPVVSSREMESVRLVASNVDSRVFAFCRARKDDVDAAIECDVDGVVLASSLSELHLRYKLKRSFEEVFEESMNVVEYAKDHFFVSFTTEDATRIPVCRLRRIYYEAVERGAKRVHLSDTVGVATPELVECYVTALKELDCELLCHFHNDFGLAVANSLRAVVCGADRVAVTVNGIGERCGNACLQEVVVALELLYGVKTGVRLEKLYDLSKLVERYSNIQIHPLAPVVGSNAFTHESGMHVAGVMENPSTYEPYPPELVGRERRVVLGKHSGRKSVEYKLRELGISYGGRRERILNLVKLLREEGYRITDDVLKVLCELE